MGNKKICNYCGTVYSDQLNRCPLCGSAETQEQESQPSGRERTVSGARRPQERRQKGAYLAKKPQRAKRSPEQEDNGVPSRFLTAASIILGIAILCMTWHILYKCNAIGWSPLGFLSESNKAGASYDESDESCWYINIGMYEVVLQSPGETVTLDVDVRPENCKDPILFESDNPAAATVSDKGVITAVSEGVANIKVRCGEKAVSCEVTCKFDQTPTESTPTSSDIDATTEPTTEPENGGEVPVTYKPILNYTDITMSSVGETVQFTVKNLPDGAKVTWSSDNDKVCTVDEKGVATAIGKGTTTIRATVGGKTAVCIVRCERLPASGSSEGSYRLSHSDVTLIREGETFRLRLLDASGNAVSDVTYTCDSPEVCTVDDKGNVKAVANGTAEIRVVSGGATYTCIVRVNIK